MLRINLPSQKRNINEMSLWFPYDLQAASSLFSDANGCKTYNPARNDSLLNIHNPTMISIWRANVDCQPVLCKHVVLKYISKYASKVEPKL